MGIVYKIVANGEESILYSFAGGSDGANPEGRVAVDANGDVFGTTSEGGASMNTFDAGVVYKIDPSGHETLLHTFSAGADGANPVGGLILDSKGNLFGTTIGGGAQNAGVVFEITAAGMEKILYTFTGGTDGGSSEAGLTVDANGNLYGTTGSGGLGHGVVFSVSRSGKETVLYRFSGGTDGGSPEAGVIRDLQGNLYGTTPVGGTGGYGTVYKLSPTGDESVLYSFSGVDSIQGQDSEGGVIFGSGGRLLGATVAGGPGGTGVIYEVSGVGQESVLFSFPGSTGGFSPEGTLIGDAAGNLYGTNSDGGIGFGVIYKILPGGQEKVLYAFTGGVDGGLPLCGVTPDAAGNLYGTTIFGGVANAGVVYKLDAAGQESTLYSFAGGADGGGPNSGVILDAVGNVYGTTAGGGAMNFGVVYEVSPGGVETVLHTFIGGADGQGPQAAVARDHAGNLYGTTISGGVGNLGVVFRIAPDGAETILHSFTGGADGGEPTSSVILDPAGSLYGTTNFGGTNFAGVLFQITGTSETVLFNFDYTDGAFPGNVVRGPSGNLYGTTYDGGTNNEGVVYEVTPGGSELVLHNFSGADGSNPTGVFLDSSGTLYGSTFGGGKTGGGVVYQVKPD